MVIGDAGSGKSGRRPVWPRFQQVVFKKQNHTEHWLKKLTDGQANRKTHEH